MDVFDVVWPAIVLFSGILVGIWLVGIQQFKRKRSFFNYLNNLKEKADVVEVQDYIEAVLGLTEKIATKTNTEFWKVEHNRVAALYAGKDELIL